MTHATLSPLPHALLMFLRGERVAWADVGLSADAMIEACAAHEAIGLLHQRLSDESDGQRWPPAIADRVARWARADAAAEALRRTELAAALDALASAGLSPILFKGTPLAYTVYEFPSMRPRGDTDLLLPRDQIDRAREALAAQGYAPSVYCDGELLFRQFELQKTDRFGIVHTLDVHWSLSTQTIFADLLTHDELSADAMPVPALGRAARAVGLVHALLIACVHPVMHHQNEARLLWTCDIDRIASSLTPEAWREVERLAVAKQIAAIVAHELEQARHVWCTEIPAETLDALSTPAYEPSAIYLAPGRGWRHEFVDNITHLPTWRSRLQLLKEVVFPSRSYMTRAYRVDGAVGAVLLPALYLHRLTTGAARVLLGRK